MLPIATTALSDSSSLLDVVDLVRSGKDAKSEKVAKVACDFESLFASQLLKEMRKTLDPDSLFGGDSGDVYGGLFDQYMGQQIAQNGGFGLAKMLREAVQHDGYSANRQTTKTPRVADRDAV